MGLATSLLVFGLLSLGAQVPEQTHTGWPESDFCAKSFLSQMMEDFEWGIMTV